MSMLDDLSPEKVKELKEMYEMLMENEDIYWMAPSCHGMIGDWFKMYWTLHNKMLEFMNQEPYQDPLTNREEFYKMKKDQGG